MGLEEPASGAASPPEDEQHTDESPSPTEESATIVEEGDICETQHVRAVPLIPRILLVVDRSGSMASERWHEATEAVELLLERFPLFEFGLALYPSVGEELACSGGRTEIDVAPSTHTDIRELLFAEDTQAIEDFGYTPTAATLVAVNNDIQPGPDTNQPHAVLLVTDGQPNCNKDGPEKFSADVEATLDAIDELKTDGVRTFVVGYHTEDYADVMDAMAEHGGTEQHYPVDDAATFTAAFGEIGLGLLPCTFELEAVPPGPEYVRLMLDGRSLPLDAVNGFSLDRKTLTLGDTACSTVRDGRTHDIEVSVECSVIHLL